MKIIVVLLLLVSVFGIGNLNANPIFGKKKDKKEIQLAGEFSLIQVFNDEIKIKETYYNGETKLCDIFYSKEEKDSIYSYREDGSILLKRYYNESGEYLEDSLFYQNGVLRKLVNYFSDSIKKEVMYYRSGEKFRSINYLNNELNDTCMLYYPNQTVAMKAVFSSGRLIAVLAYNDSVGKPLVDKYVRDGSGEFIVYYFNLENRMFSDNKIMKMTLENGHVDGKLHLYDTVGNLDEIFSLKSDTLFSVNKPSGSFRRYFSIANGKLVFDMEKLFLEIKGDKFNFLGYKPSFKGGDRALMTFLSKNLKYPEDAISEKASGKVYVQFEINESGMLENIKVLRGKYESLNKEALRVVSMLPDWTPAFQHNVPVPVTYVIPINFN